MKRSDIINRAADIRRLAYSPEELAGRINGVAGAVQDYEPEVAGSIASTVGGDVAYLNTTMPQEDSPSPFTPQVQGPEPDAEQLAEWGERYTTLDDPDSVLRAMAEGSMSRIQVDTLKERRPEVYEKIKGMYLEEFSQLEHEIPYHERLNIGMLFDIEADKSLGAVGFLQQAFGGTQSGRDQQPKMTGVNDFKRGQDMAPESQRAETRR